jgi:hypothetical protein
MGAAAPIVPRSIVFGVVFVGFTLFGIAVSSSFGMWRNRKPGDAGWDPRLAWAPLNLIFLPHLLNAHGLKYRRRLIAMVVLALLIFVIFGCLGALSHAT